MKTLLILSLCLFSCLVQAQIPITTDQVKERLIGHFTNHAQADTSSSPIYIDQELICVPLYGKFKKGDWMYVGWFKTGFLNYPVGQAFWELEQVDEYTVKLVFYDIPNERDYKGTKEWEQSKPFKKIAPKDLTENTSCGHYISAVEDGSFKVSYTSDPCPKNMGDQAQFFGFEAVLTLNAQIHYTQFYDKNKKATFSYAVGNRFQRIIKEEPVTSASE